MSLKTRHIHENMKQVMNELLACKYKEALSKIRWEKNSFVTHHQEIDPDDIIDKTTTDKFPDNAATVRFQSLAKKIASVYFYGKQRTMSDYNSGYTYTYTDKKLKVFLPHTRHNNYKCTYSFNGELPDTFSLDQMSAVLEYVHGIVNS